jgi:epoxyqueuosine reductase QueG
MESPDFCRECSKCVDACPADAFDTGRYDREACLSYCESNLKPVSQYSVLWCRACSDVCPIGEDLHFKHSKDIGE